MGGQQGGCIRSICPGAPSSGPCAPPFEPGAPRFESRAPRFEPKAPSFRIQNSIARASSSALRVCSSAARVGSAIARALNSAPRFGNSVIRVAVLRCPGFQRRHPSVELRVRSLQPVAWSSVARAGSVVSAGVSADATAGAPGRYMRPGRLQFSRAWGRLRQCPPEATSGGGRWGRCRKRAAVDG